MTKPCPFFSAAAAAVIDTFWDKSTHLFRIASVDLGLLLPVSARISTTLLITVRKKRHTELFYQHRVNQALDDISFSKICLIESIHEYFERSKVFKAKTPTVITASNIISGRLRLLKDVLPVSAECLTFCNNIIPYLKKREEMPMANRIQREIYRIKQGKDILLHYFKVGDLLFEYENMETFHIRKNIEENYIT